MSLRGEALLDALERGEVRAAEPDGAGGWIVHAWVKEAILEIFRESEIVEQGVAQAQQLLGGDPAAAECQQFDSSQAVLLAWRL